MPLMDLTVDAAFDAVSEVGRYADQATTPGNTTTDAAQTAGDTVLSVADETNFAADEFLRIGSGENQEVHEIASTAVGQITIKTPLLFDQPSGAAVVEKVETNMGHVGEAGVTYDLTEDEFELNAATSAQALTTKTVRTRGTLGWPGLNWSMEAVAASFGIDPTKVSGSGTAADPHQLGLIADNFNGLKNDGLYMKGVLEGGANIVIRAFNVKYDLNKSATFSRNAAAELPLSGRYKGVSLLEWT